MTLNHLKKQTGMTLVETMAAGALLAGLAVAGMTMFKNQSTGQKTVEANYEITNLFQQIRVVLSDQQNCTQAFAGKNPNGDSSVTSLFKKRVGAAGFDTVYSTNTQISGSNVKITSFRLERIPVANLATNETWLKISFTKGKSTLMENTTKMMKMIVSPSPAASNTSITSCYAYNNSTDTYWMQSTPPDIYFTAGKVGIGTSSPQSLLDVNGPVNIGSRLWGGFTFGSDYFWMGLNGTASSVNRLGLGLEAQDATGQMKAFHFFTMGSEKMVLDSAGNLGVGISFPAQKLSVAGGLGISEVGGSGNRLQITTSPAGTFINHNDNSNMHFQNLGSTKMSIVTATGNVGIGTTNPGYKLEVAGDIYANSGWLRTSGNAGWYSETYGGGWYMIDTTWLRAYNNKNVYTAGQMRADGSMQVGGGSEITMVPASGITSTNGYWYPSDRRLKKDISDLDQGLEQILKMKPRNYTWKNSGKKETGFIAQELQSIDPRLVQEMKDKQKTLTLKHEGLLPYIVKALQELHDMILGDRERITDTEARLSKLEKQNVELLEIVRAQQKEISKLRQ